MRNLSCAIGALLFSIFVLLPASGTLAGEITLAAANSTCPTLKKAGEIFSQQHDMTINYICKSSGALAKGLESGYITADYFISASKKWTDRLVAAKMMKAEDITPLWANRLVAAVPHSATLQLNSWDELTTAKVSKIVVGDPSSTPLGRQFKKAMVAQGLWLQVRGKIVAMRHLSLTRETVEEAGDDGTIGIMFPTSIGKKLKTVLEMSPEWHDPIRYYAGTLLASPRQEETATFASFLQSKQVRELFCQAGYICGP